MWITMHKTMFEHHLRKSLTNLHKWYNDDLIVTSIEKYKTISQKLTPIDSHFLKECHDMDIYAKTTEIKWNVQC